jgi:hypothetical protein
MLIERAWGVGTNDLHIQFMFGESRNDFCSDALHGFAIVLLDLSVKHGTQMYS